MTGTLWRQLGELYHGALALSASERRAFLDRACPNEALRREVESLLASGAEGSLQGPLAGALSPLLVNDDAMIGQRLGAYEVECLIGAGGMGRVYLAVRADGQFDQQVAVKVIRGLESEHVLGRFQEEKQNLARLDHPYIARLLDAGEAPNGRHFLLMDWVDGQHIDVYCDEQGLSAKDRLQLFTEVCAVVHHAHQRLVIHRDLKPGNILVTRDGTPRLLDFGIATVMERRGSWTSASPR